MMKETNIQSQVTSTIAGDDGEAMARSEGYVAENGFVATDPMHWYVACVRVNYEKKFKILIEQNFKDRKFALETWLPLEKRVMINSRGKRVIREAVFLTTFVFVRVEDKNLNEIRFRSDVYKMLSESGKSAPYAIPDSKFGHFSEREFEEKVATSIIQRLMAESASLMTLSVLIGRYQPNMPSSRRKIQNMMF